MIPPSTSPPSHEEEEEKETKGNKAPHNNTISPLPRRYSVNQGIHPRYPTRSHCNPSINTRQRLPLHEKAIIDRVRLAQHAIHHVVATVNVVPLIEHVLRLRRLGIIRAVVADVGLHIGEEIGLVASLLQRSTEAVEIASVGGELFAQEGKIVLLEGG